MQQTSSTLTLHSSGIAPTPSSESAAPSSKPKYTVPTILHIPSDTYIMDSTPIAHFLETTYPSPPLPLTSPLGQQIQSQARSIIGALFQVSIPAREIHILSPRSQSYFRRTREASLLPEGQRLEDLLSPADDPGKEERMWREMDGEIRKVGHLLRTNRHEGPFVLGASPSLTDFFSAGALRAARGVDEGVWGRIVAFEGCEDVYAACERWMVRED
ncbi:hypothetical protein MMC25_007666 [Agyrium rufum]|nr:hypothetical protein [Agyrium rufum]